MDCEIIGYLMTEPNMIHKFEWLVDKFFPIPTWPEDYKKLWLVQ